jgi:CSLREA domain-containing protein
MFTQKNNPFVLIQAHGKNLKHLLMRGMIVFTIMLVLFAATPITPAYAQTYTVNSLTDADDGFCNISNCTLREAINAANLNHGVDVITVPAGTININMATFNGFNITDDLTIEGAGYDQTILDGGMDPGIAPVNFYTVVSVSNANVILRNLRIQQGSTTGYGGGINQSGGSLTLEGVRIHANRSDGIGGGIYVYNADLTITDSDISFNKSVSGGGIGFVDDNAGHDTVFNVNRATIESNIADSSSGVFFENDNGTHTLLNVTISGNVASDNSAAGVFQDDDNNSSIVPTIRFINTTITENEAEAVIDPVDGISLDYVKIETVNTIFDKAVDSHSACSSEVVFENNSLSQGSNISSDTSCWFLDDPSDMINTNPHLASITQVSTTIGRMHPISLNSPALDSGNVVYCVTNNIIADGRNSTRPVDGDADGYDTCDIGAYELNPSIRYVAKTGNDTGNNCSNSSLPCATILRAILEAADGDQIQIGAGTYQEGEIAPFGKSLIFNGNGTGLTILDGADTNRVLFVYFGSKQILRNLNIENGYSNSDGGGIYAVGALELENVIVQNNTAANDGGGIYTETDVLNVFNGYITMNEAETGHGGGIFAGGLTNLVSSTISGNAANGGNSIGGGVHIQSDSPNNQFFNVTVSKNNSTSHGNGISFSGTGLTSIVHTTIFENGATNIYVASSVSFLNSIVAGSTSDQCLVEIGGSLISDGYNLQGDASCGFANTGDIQIADPQLLPLGDFTGPIPTHGFTVNSPVVDAGLPSADPACDYPNEDARGISRNQDGNNDTISACDMGAFELAYEPTAPTVNAITRINDDPTSASSVQYYVGFSHPVYGVDINDFEVTTSGISNAEVVSVTGSGAVYTVTVGTGSGAGTLRLDIHNSASISNLSGIAISGLPYTSGEFYTKPAITLITKSAPANDGWILESSETSNAGGSLNSSNTNFFLGDDAADRQYRAILHFDTSALPDTAVVTNMTLKIKQQGNVVGVSPFSFGSLYVDMRNPAFGNSILELVDFSFAAKKVKPAVFNPNPVSGWFSARFNTGGKLYVNRTGVTQLRLYFSVDDNNNNIADFIRFYSGNASADSRPKLLIQYYVP